MTILQPPTEEDLTRSVTAARYWNVEPNLLPLSIIFGFSSDVTGSERERAERIALQEGIDLHEYLQLVVVPNKVSFAFQKGGVLEFDTDDRYHHEVLKPFVAIVDSLAKISKKRGRPQLGSYVHGNVGQ